MNKQRYLGELQSLLVFMTEEDRELAIRHYGDIFDAAGEDRADELIRSFGSPTKSAIALSRGYEPGSIKNLPTSPVLVHAPKARPVPTPLPTFELPPLEENTTEELPAEAEIAPTVVENAKPEAPTDSRKEESVPVPEPEEPELYYERTMPLGAGIALLVLVMAALGVPLAALVFALIAVCLAPGAAVVFGAYLAAVGGLWCLTYMADAILMFGLAFLILAVGLVLLWGGIWLASRLALLYVHGVQWLCGELLGRQVTDDE